MQLFYTPGSCALSPHIILRETGLDFSLVRVDLKAKKTENGDDYLKINPKGQVPALSISDSQLLTEGVAIVQYLADQKPDRKLIARRERWNVIIRLNGLTILPAKCIKATARCSLRKPRKITGQLHCAI